jgi:hypothetical protein
MVVADVFISPSSSPRNRIQHACASINVIRQDCMVIARIVAEILTEIGLDLFSKLRVSTVCDRAQLPYWPLVFLPA